MRSTIRLGRVAGIPLGAHWSVLVIIALVTDVLARSVLPQTAAGASTTTYWVVGTAISLVFFASLLAHETAHAVVARRHGVKVESITLWMLGGVTQLEGNPPDARSDLHIALAGPLVSFGCAAAAGGAALGLYFLDAPDVATAGLGWLAVTNGILAVFNLLPGAPLDGGRVLRAVVWRRTGNRSKAALVATRAGRVTGMGLLWLGAMEALVTSNFVGGLWLALIGWFLMSASAAEMQETAGEVAFAGVTVGDVMEIDFLVLPAYQQAEVAARRAVDADADACPVCDIDGKPVGVIAVDRLVAAAASPNVDARVGDVAEALRPGMVVAPGDPLADALLHAARTRLLLVVDDERLVGVVTAADVNHARRRGLLAAAALAGAPAEREGGEDG